MPKKESVNRFPVFSQRFRSLRGKTSQDKFADFLGISRPTVGFYENGDHLPDALTLSQIAKKCNVSADYLLGLSDAKAQSDAAVIAATGLSKKSIDFIKRSANQSFKLAGMDDNRHIIDVINLFLESDAELFFDFLQPLTSKENINYVLAGWENQPDETVITLPDINYLQEYIKKNPPQNGKMKYPPLFASAHFRDELHKELDDILKRMQKTIIDEWRRKVHNAR